MRDRVVAHRRDLASYPWWAIILEEWNHGWEEGSAEAGRAQDDQQTTSEPGRDQERHPGGPQQDGRGHRQADRQPHRMDAGNAGGTPRSPRNACTETALPLPREEGRRKGVGDAAVRAGESPHPIDDIHRPGRGGMAGVRRGRRTVANRRRRKPTVLPGRRLRFDSATESRFTSSVPAGSPWLAEARLQSLAGRSPTRPASCRRPLPRRPPANGSSSGLSEPPSRARKPSPTATAAGRRERLSGRPWVARSSTWPPKPLNPCTE